MVPTDDDTPTADQMLVSGNLLPYLAVVELSKKKLFDIVNVTVLACDAPDRSLPEGVGLFTIDKYSGILNMTQGT